MTFKQVKPGHYVLGGNTTNKNNRKETVKPNNTNKMDTNEKVFNPQNVMDIEIAEETKVCSACGRRLPLSEFYKGQGRCKACFNKACQEHRKKKKEETLKAKEELIKAIERKEKQLSDYSEDEIIAEIKRRNIPILVKYTPRDLMENLYKMGYRGKLTYTIIKTVDLDHLSD